MHTFCTSQAGLFVAREDAFQRPVLNVVRFEQSHFHSDSDAIVSAERSAFRFHPFTIDIGLDGILREVEVDVAILLADHIHVALQDDCLAVLHSWGCRLADDDVSCFVSAGIESKFLSEIEQELNHLFFLFRWARDLIHLCKAFEHALGL